MYGFPHSERQNKDNSFVFSSILFQYFKEFIFRFFFLIRLNFEFLGATLSRIVNLDMEDTSVLILWSTTVPQ